MTKQVDILAKCVIIAMLVWLTISVNKINKKVFPDPNIMIPLVQKLDWNRN
jgi:hypothetical protein